MKRFLKYFPYAVMIFALWLLAREVRSIDWSAFRAELLGYPLHKIGLSLVLLVANFFAMSLYDFVALRQLAERVPYREIVRTTFPAFAISNFVGHSMITGLAIRVRDYTRCGVKLSKIGQIMVMNVESWWIGFFALYGVVLAKMPIEDLKAYASFLSVGLGLGLLAIVIVYLGACRWMSGRTVHLGRFEIFLPSFETGVMKVLVGAADTLFMSLTLYVLMPQELDLSFARFVSLHLTAHFIGVVTMVPGGLGVLEGVLLKLLEPYAPRPAILASILLFRLVHFVLPAALTLVSELFRRRR